MKHIRFILLTVLVFIIASIGIRFLVSRTPVKLEGSAWNSIEKCAENQKNLYQSVEYYVEQYGRPPISLEEFSRDYVRSSRIRSCPETQEGYEVFLENYGNRKAIFIRDKTNRHPSSFIFWLRGLTPQVQTMGDGTIQLFKGGKILTMVGSKSKK